MDIVRDSEPALASALTTTRQIDTTSYAAMDYLVVLQASIGGGPEETLPGPTSASRAPDVPSLSAPPDSSDVDTLTPVLVVNNAADPNDDKLFSEFELYADSGLTTLITSAGGIAQGPARVIPGPCRACGEQHLLLAEQGLRRKLHGDWMQSASFRVNVANDPPTAPTIASPPDGTEVSVLTRS